MDLFFIVNGEIGEGEIKWAKEKEKDGPVGDNIRLEAKMKTQATHMFGAKSPDSVECHRNAEYQGVEYSDNTDQIPNKEYFFHDLDLALGRKYVDTVLVKELEDVAPILDPSLAGSMTKKMLGEKYNQMMRINRPWSYVFQYQIRLIDKHKYLEFLRANKLRILEFNGVALWVLDETMNGLSALDVYKLYKYQVD